MDEIHVHKTKKSICAHFAESPCTSRNMAEELSLSHTTIFRHLHKMGKQYFANRWLPHFLSDENKANREKICGCSPTERLSIPSHNGG